MLRAIKENRKKILQCLMALFLGFVGLAMLDVLETLTQWVRNRRRK